MNDPKKDDWISLLSGLSAPQGLSGPLGAVPGASVTPVQPSKTSYTQLREAEERFQKRLQKLNEILPISAGRVLPDLEDLILGDARRLDLSVLFLDICGFSRIQSFEDDEQDKVLKLLNLFMAEMLFIVRAHEGVFEKNTGDGLMAYFGEANPADHAKRAVDAAVTMHCYNDQIISPKLEQLGLPKVKFRVGIDSGRATIAKVGVRGDHHSLVAIGDVANIACKLMTLIPDGGIILGHATRDYLSEDWKKETVQADALPNFVIKGTTTPYPSWLLKYRVPNPGPLLRSLLATRNGLLGNK